MKEVWKPIVGYEKELRISNDGKVKSIDHLSRRQHHTSKKVYYVKVKGHLIPVFKNKYRNNRLMFTYKENDFSLSRELYKSFKDPYIDGYDIHHIDGNPENNDLNNLKKITPEEHKKTDNYGSKSPNYKSKNTARRVLATKGGNTEVFKSVVEFANFVGVGESSVRNALSKVSRGGKVKGYNVAYEGKVAIEMLYPKPFSGEKNIRKIKSGAYYAQIGKNGKTFTSPALHDLELAKAMRDFMKKELQHAKNCH